jgi:hypothetical protein
MCLVYIKPENVEPTFVENNSRDTILMTNFSQCLKMSILPGVVVHTYNPSPQKAKQEGSKFEASLGYIARPCLRGWRVKKIIYIYTNSNTLSCCPLPSRSTYKHMVTRLLNAQ